MHFVLLGAVASLFGLSQSFLIPPEVTAAQVEIFEKFSVEYATPLDKNTVHLECPGCPVITNPGGQTEALQTDNSLLELNFTIRHDNGDQLMLNNVPIYPIDNNHEFSPNPPSAPQMIKNKDNEWEYSSSLEFAFSTRIQQTLLNSDKEGLELELVTINIDILEAGNVFLIGMPTVELELLKLSTGELHIRKTEIRKPQTSLLSVVELQECSTLLCRWKVMLISSLTKPKEATKPCSHHPDPARSQSDKKPLRFNNNSPHYQKPSRLPHIIKPSNILRRIFYHALVLVMFGILLSISACILGGIIGHFVISMWTKMGRHNPNGYMSVHQTDTLDERKDGFKDQPLPDYSFPAEKNGQ